MAALAVAVALHLLAAQAIPQAHRQAKAAMAAHLLVLVRQITVLAAVAARLLQAARELQPLAAMAALVRHRLFLAVR